MLYSAALHKSLGTKKGAVAPPGDYLQINPNMDACNTLKIVRSVKNWCDYLYNQIKRIIQKKTFDLFTFTKTYVITCGTNYTIYSRKHHWFIQITNTPTFPNKILPCHNTTKPAGIRIFEAIKCVNRLNYFAKCTRRQVRNKTRNEMSTNVHVTGCGECQVHNWLYGHPLEWQLGARPVCDVHLVIVNVPGETKVTDLHRTRVADENVPAC